MSRLHFGAAVPLVWRKFPSLAAKSLAADRASPPISFPDDVGGRLKLLLLSFSVQQHHQLSSWLPYVATLQRHFQSLHTDKADDLLRVYRLVIRSRSARAIRWLLEERWRLLLLPSAAAAPAAAAAPPAFPAAAAASESAAAPRPAARLAGAAAAADAAAAGAATDHRVGAAHTSGADAAGGGGSAAAGGRAAPPGAGEAQRGARTTERKEELSPAASAAWEETRSSDVGCSSREGRLIIESDRSDTCKNLLYSANNSNSSRPLPSSSGSSARSLPQKGGNDVKQRSCSSRSTVGDSSSSRSSSQWRKTGANGVERETFRRQQQQQQQEYALEQQFNDLASCFFAYTNKRQFLAATALPDSQRPYLLLLDEENRIRWGEHEAFNAQEKLHGCLELQQLLQLPSTRLLLPSRRDAIALPQ